MQEYLINVIRESPGLQTAAHGKRITHPYQSQ